MVEKFLPKLSQNLLDVLNDEEFYDITIEVGKDPYENDGTFAHIKLPNISPEIFQIILRYIYGGNVSLEECDALDIIKILGAASELGLHELVTYLQSFLVENKTKWIEENFNFVYQTSFENNSFLELQKYCTDLISKEPDKIFKSPNFSSIPEKILISLIQNDHLQMSEVQIWDQVIKWGIAQNSDLSSNFTNYSKDNFKTLKKYFTTFITLQKLLPKELYEDLLSLSDSDSKPINKTRHHKTNNNLFLTNNDKNFVTEDVSGQAEQSVITELMNKVSEKDTKVDW
ncbi:unnamed protein product [Rhizophagus irregularis]|nr:unnamed protein product [Rhizophagus irregularis]